jgi:anaerobic selenocysteine-containing dehydrogenase
MQWASLAETEAVVLDLAWADPPAAPADTGGLTLVAPRVLYDGGTLLGQAEILGARLAQPHVALSRADARTLGVSDGDPVQVAVDGRLVTLPARVDGAVPQGVIAIPHNLRGRPAEALLEEGRVYAHAEVSRG